MTGGPLYLVAVIRPRPDRLAEADRELRALMSETRRESGCVRMDLVVEEGEDGNAPIWYMLEQFRSRADWDLHMQTDHVTEGNRRLADLLREPTVLHFYTDKQASPSG